METHGSTLSEVCSFQFPFERWHSSEERATKLVVPHHRTEQGVCQVNSDLECVFVCVFVYVCVFVCACVLM